MGVEVRASVLLFLLFGCTTVVPPERFFTDEEDAKARALCEESGCALIPIPLLKQLLDDQGKVAL